LRKKEVVLWGEVKASFKEGRVERAGFTEMILEVREQSPIYL